VAAVRTARDPLGDYPPDKKMGLLDRSAWRRRILQQHRIAQRTFFSEAPQYAGRLARLDLVVNGDPFDATTAAQISAVRRWIEKQTEDPESVWSGAELAVAGTTASIIDLRRVTLRDNRRIKVAGVLAVLAVLVLVLRRFWLSLYLIFTVLLSYFATLGLTVGIFRALYGETYVGLDWKLPLFLFVILVAVGQDYNVYLVTRVLEEQRQGGWLAALRRAVARTGGIITSCGLVMAGTFFCMTASAWFPAVATLLGIPAATDTPRLRGIIELGFALGLGVLIDTFYVRTLLVPAFITVLDRFRARQRSSLARAEREAIAEADAEADVS
jgi:RND superfamily putative drug exporter